MNEATTSANSTPAAVPSVGAAWRLFMSHRPPRILVAAFGLLLGARMRILDVSLWDAAIVGGMLLLHPFVEWIIHVYVLHAKPRKMGDAEVDFRISRYHRNHHKDPWDMQWVVMPMPEAAIGLGIHMAVMAAVLPTWSLRLTAMTMAVFLGLLYEWVHFLVHTSYKPRSAAMKKIWRYHRLHHFKNEHFWFGVSMHLGDFVFGTMPNKDAVPSSKTARNLGHEDDLAS